MKLIDDLKENKFELSVSECDYYNSRFIHYFFMKSIRKRILTLLKRKMKDSIAKYIGTKIVGQ